MGDSIEPAHTRALGIAVEKAADIRQEGHEFAVVPQLEIAGGTAEFIARLTPGIVGAGALQQLPVLLDLRPFADRHELQRPEQDLPKLPDEFAVVDWMDGHGLRPP